MSSASRLSPGLVLKSCHSRWLAGDVSLVVQLIGSSHQSGVNARDKHNRTPLHLAAWAGHADVAKVLLSFEYARFHRNAVNQILIFVFIRQCGGGFARAGWRDTAQLCRPIRTRRSSEGLDRSGRKCGAFDFQKRKVLFVFFT